ncbi:GntR family transcriptional regulator [Amycolatopsis sp. NPDC059657]|uniref:GntR family transcriptional regulator n=1 Tax=Amycolatopsis sp. NPDC059657 TaxID=3346899 RepID=UPI00366BD62A
MADVIELQRGNNSVLEVARILRTDIEAGRYRHQEQLAPTRVLAQQCGTSIATISRALDLLVKEGLVVTKPRAGSFVNIPGADQQAGAARGRTRQIKVIVAGYAGSGKTEVGRIISRLTGWAMEDKDTGTRPVVEAMLRALGRSPHDRESEVYLEQVRPAEYEALRELALENLSCGNSVVATAPYLRELADRQWCQREQADADALGVELRVIWVRTDADSMLVYLKRRGAARDTHKLEHWDEYVANVRFDFTPEMPHHVLDNSIQDPPLQTQVEQLLERWGVPTR